MYNGCHSKFRNHPLGSYHGVDSRTLLLDDDGCCHQVFDLPESRSLRAFAIRITGCQYIRRRHAHDEGLAEPCFRRLLVRSCFWILFPYPDLSSSLTLTAALPVQTDPIEAAKVARAFGSHPCAQPGDIRLAGLTELVAILHEGAKSCVIYSQKD